MGLLQSLGFVRPRGEADRLYDAVVRQARAPEFYVLCGVPDTVAGRFDMVTLHAYVVLRRLKELGGRGDQKGTHLAQAVFDRMFADFDQNLREMGVGDLAVGHRIKDLAKLFYGRLKAYDEATAGEAMGLAAALERNAFADGAPTQAQLASLAAYLRGAIAQSRSWSLETLAHAKIDFPLPPKAE